MGLQIDAPDFDKIFEEIGQDVMREVQPNVEAGMWKATQQMAEELTDVLREALHELYNRMPTSKFYDRTGEFADSVYVKPTQGHGSYGLSIRWIVAGEEGGIQVHPAPLTKNDKRGKKFNAHANFKLKAIDIDTLVSIEDQRKSVLTLIARTTDEFLRYNDWDAHLSLINYDEFGFEEFI